MFVFSYFFLTIILCFWIILLLPFVITIVHFQVVILIVCVHSRLKWIRFVFPLVFLWHYVLFHFQSIKFWSNEIWWQNNMCPFFIMENINHAICNVAFDCMVLNLYDNSSSLFGSPTKILFISCFPHSNCFLKKVIHVHVKSNELVIFACKVSIISF
jgi:hypothetical protein